MNNTITKEMGLIYGKPIEFGVCALCGRLFPEDDDAARTIDIIGLPICSCPTPKVAPPQTVDIQTVITRRIDK
jgi:hypothetical protein